MKKIHLVVVSIMVIVTLVSFKRNMFAWIDASSVYLAGELRGGGFKVTWRDLPTTSWRANAGWYTWSPSVFDGYDGYYVGWPEYPTGSDWSQWRFCGLQIVTDRRGGPSGTLESVDLLIPMWLPIVMYLFPVVWRTVRMRRMMKQGRCLHCGYQVIGATCSECGAATPSRIPNTGDTHAFESTAQQRKAA